MFRIVVNFGSAAHCRANLERIRGIVARSDDDVACGGHLMQVLTAHPEKFIASYFDEGYTATFTFQEEIV